MCLAVPGRIVSVTGDDIMRAARIDFGGVVKEASLAYTPEAQIGDYVLVHVGFALTVIDEARALRTIDDLIALASLDDEGGSP